MITHLTQEQSVALQATGVSLLEFVDPNTARRYVLVDAETHRQALEALRLQQDRKAIAEGLAQLAAGQGVPVDEAFARLRANLGNSARS